jgi:ATP-dependent exoDNAse (exonuclease V) beta subunit
LFRFAEVCEKRDIHFQISGSRPWLAHQLTDLFVATLEWQADPSSRRGPLSLMRWSLRHTDQWTSINAQLERELRNTLELDHVQNQWHRLLENFASLVQPRRWEGGAEWCASMERCLQKLQSSALGPLLGPRELAQFLSTNQQALSGDILNETPMQPTNGTISLYTIHGSKGLEFDAVILGDLSGGDRRGQEHYDADADEIIVRAKLSVENSFGRSRFYSLSYFARALAERRQLEAESRRLLYVALTRAKTCLDIILPPPPKTAEDSNTMTPLSVLGLPDTTPENWAKLIRQGAHIAQISEILSQQQEAPETDKASPVPEIWDYPSLSKNIITSATRYVRSGVTQYLQKLNSGLQTRDTKSSKAPDKLNNESQQMGLEVHACLEVWNGTEPHLESLLREHPQKEILRQVLIAVRRIPELQDLWQAIQTDEDPIYREFGVFILKSDARLSGVADLVWSRPHEWAIIDWKSSRHLKNLQKKERLATIREQLSLYATSLPQDGRPVRGLAIGISPEATAPSECAVTLINEMIR